MVFNATFNNISIISWLTKAAIRYGKVNVRAMIPKGDWIWPGNYED
jgi:hypothetical protein